MKENQEFLEFLAGKCNTGVCVEQFWPMQTVCRSFSKTARASCPNSSCITSVEKCVHLHLPQSWRTLWVNTAKSFMKICNSCNCNQIPQLPQIRSVRPIWSISSTICRSWLDEDLLCTAHWMRTDCKQWPKKIGWIEKKKNQRAKMQRASKQTAFGLTTSQAQEWLLRELDRLVVCDSCIEPSLRGEGNKTAPNKSTAKQGKGSATSWSHWSCEKKACPTWSWCRNNKEQGDDSRCTLGDVVSWRDGSGMSEGDSQQQLHALQESVWCAIGQGKIDHLQKTHNG